MYIKNIKIIVILIFLILIIYFSKENNFIKNTLYSALNNLSFEKSISKKYSPPISEGYDDIIFHFIDVGNGDSSLIQTEGYNVLIDTGEDMYSDKLLEYLSEFNVDKIDLFILTHPHSDHMDGLDEILDNIYVKKIVLPDIEIDRKIIKDYIDSYNSVRDNKVIIEYVKKDDRFILGNSFIKIISPSPKKYTKVNNMSIVLMYSYKEISIFYASDMEKELEIDISNSNSNIKSDILKVPHHGSITSSTKSILDNIMADIYIISVGKENKYNHPSIDILDRIRRYSKQVYRTDFNGNIIITSDGIKKVVHTSR
ncbi:MAG: MBL fold metallo-hydrolase [Oscillospiraceae bacterium]|nr:MBL fold metallo-hydrolase [Oscillospiraceae bacterium]